jgi:Uma2 family endonuclease
MLAQKDHFYTHQEYFAFEEKSEYKNEYRQGEIVAMAGGSANHNRIAGNVFNVLSSAIESKPCEVFISDLRLWAEKKDLYTYPDVMVICGGLEFVEGRTDTITNPKVIIEVLSKSTEAYDRSDKFQAYWSLDSFEEYVLIDQYRVHVEYFRRTSDKEWILRVLTKTDDILKLESIGVEISLNTIYRNVI